MSKLGQTLKEEMPIKRVLAECGECGVELFDSVKHSPESAIITGDIITMKARAHRETSNHCDLQVKIEKRPTTEPIDFNITVR